MSLYETAIAPVRRSLANLGQILERGAAHFAEAGVPEAEWLDARLAPDMFPFSRQIHAATSAARQMAQRLTGEEATTIPPAAEPSVGELRDRIAQTITYLDSVQAGAVDGQEERAITLKLPSAEIPFTGSSYVRIFGLPNFFFHTVTAYGILRAQGVPVGKMNYLGGFD